MAMSSISIPIIDTRPENPQAAQQLLDAAAEYGFVFVDNNAATGITPAAIEHMFHLSQTFFASPLPLKQEVGIHSSKAGANHGWLGQGVEKLDPKVQKRPDVKESVIIFSIPPYTFLSTPDLYAESSLSLQRFPLSFLLPSCFALSPCCLSQLSLITAAERSTWVFLSPTAPSTNPSPNRSNLTFPPLRPSKPPATTSVNTSSPSSPLPCTSPTAPGSPRATTPLSGPRAPSSVSSTTHTGPPSPRMPTTSAPAPTPTTAAYASLELPPSSSALTLTRPKITLLFQQPHGAPGLEIQTSSGAWAPVPVDPTPSHVPVPILVNIGDLLEDWTNGLLRSTVHRVVFPATDTGADRYSMAYFCHPLDSALLEPVPSRLVQDRAACADSSRATMTAKDHLMERLAATYSV